MSDADDRSNFEVIRDTLLQMDPETRHQVIETMKVIRTLPVPAAVRVLSEAGMRARLLEVRPGLLTGG